LGSGFQFDWSTSVQLLTIPNGIETLTLTGTATFTYDIVANQGTIFGLPEYSDPFEDTSYTFSTYFSDTNTLNGSVYAFPATTFADLTVYHNVFINNGGIVEPAMTFWIMNPSLFDGYLEDGVFAINPPASTIGRTSGDGYPTGITGTYDNLIQIAPEPGSIPLILVGASLLMIFCTIRRKSFA
jgi:hypothetical protein